MWLINLPKIRVKKHPKGYVVEIEKRKWYGKKYWIHLEATSGIEKQLCYYSTFDIAVSETANRFRWDLIDESSSFKVNSNKQVSARKIM